MTEQSDDQQNHERLRNEATDLLLAASSPARNIPELKPLIDEHEGLVQRRAELNALEAKLAEVLPVVEQAEADVAAAEKQAEEIMRQFDAGLEKLRSEILSNIDKVDLLDHDEAGGLVDRLNQRFVVSQHDFLEYLSRLSGSSSGSVERFVLSPPDSTIVPEATAGGVGAITGGVVVNLISLTVPGWLWGTTTTTLATGIGTALGVGASVVTIGAAAVVGVVAGGAIYVVRLRKRRKFVRTSILKSFDEDAAPKLREWARRTVGMSKKLGDA